MRRLGLLVVGLALAATGCATTSRPRPAGVDVSGTWSGMWLGHGIIGVSEELAVFGTSAGMTPRATRSGIVAIPRELPASVELIQNGKRGYGRIVLDGTAAAEAVPVATRVAGSTGARGGFQVSGSRPEMNHQPVGSDLN